MKYLEKTWVKILVSLIAASFCVELIHVTSSKPNLRNTTQDSNRLFLFAVIIFALLYFLGPKKK